MGKCTIKIKCPGCKTELSYFYGDRKVRCVRCKKSYPTEILKGNHFISVLSKPI